jgi:hypothetical protein
MEPQGFPRARGLGTACPGKLRGFVQLRLGSIFSLEIQQPLHGERWGRRRRPILEVFCMRVLLSVNYRLKGY